MPENEIYGYNPNPSALAGYAGVGPVTLNSIIDKAEAATSKLKGLKEITAAAEVGYGKRALEVEATFARIPIIDAADKARIEGDIARAKGQIFREAVKASETNRYAKLKEIQAIEESLAAVAEHFSTPAVILARAGLGTSELGRHMERLANSGPLEILNFAREAASTGDKILGAAVMARLDALKPSERKLARVSRQELAETLAGKEHKAAQASFVRAKNALREAMAENRAFAKGERIKGRDKIGLGLARPGEVGPELEEVE